MTQIGFWTPVRYGVQSTSLGQKIRECADSYFHLGGRVAVVMPGVVQNNSVGVRLQPEAVSCWRTALKVVSCITLILPALMFMTKVISRYSSSFHVCHQILSDGTEEVGTFVHGVLQKGVRIQGEEIFFLRPKTILLGATPLQQEGIALNFAEVSVNGRKEIIPV